MSWPFCSNLPHKCQYMDVFPPRLFIYSREKSFDLLPGEVDSWLMFWEPFPSPLVQCVCFLSLQPLLRFSLINLLPAWRGVCGIQSGLATRSGLGNCFPSCVESPSCMELVFPRADLLGLSGQLALVSVVSFTVDTEFAIYTVLQFFHPFF